MNKKEFIEKLHNNGIELTEDMMRKFEMYYETLKEYNSVMDLTNEIEEERVYQRHFYESISLFFNVKMENKSLCDIGSGAGFPGIPIKIVFPSISLTIVESNKKRTDFLAHLTDKLSISNVFIENIRAEDISSKLRESFDVVTARAVAKLPILSELCSPYLKKNGTLLLPKGSNYLEELEDSKNAFKELRLVLDHIEKHIDEDGIERNNLFITKTDSLSNKYPRNYSAIKKHPL